MKYVEHTLNYENSVSVIMQSSSNIPCLKISTIFHINKQTKINNWINVGSNPVDLLIKKKKRKKLFVISFLKNTEDVVKDLIFKLFQIQNITRPTMTVFLEFYLAVLKFFIWWFSALLIMRKLQKSIIFGTIKSPSLLHDVITLTNDVPSRQNFNCIKIPIWKNFDVV